MQPKSNRLFRSLFLCGLAAGFSPVYANNAAMLQSAEASVQMFKTRGETNNPSYVYQLMSLANAYKVNGRRAEAHKTYKMALALGAQLKGFDVPSLMMSWAMSLAYPPLETQGMSKEQLKRLAAERAAYVADLPNAEKIVQEGLEIANKLPANSDQRLRYMLGTVRFYKALGKRQQMQERIKSLDEHIQRLERDAKLSESDISQIAEKLREISQIICQSPRNADLTSMVPVHVVADSEPESPFITRKSDFKTAEGYELRAVALYDRLPENHYLRISAHRNLAKWYRYFNQSNQEAEQTIILSKLLKTSDPAKLFPAIDRCPGCGRG